MMLICERALVFCDARCARAAGPDPERIPPLAAAADSDGARRHACMMLVENPAHRFTSWSRATGWRPSAVQVRGSRIEDAETVCPLTREPPRSDRPEEHGIGRLMSQGS